MENVFPSIDKSDLDTFYITIGKNVKKLRNSKKITQLELAILMGHRTASFLSNCENYKNKEHFNLEHLFLISKILEVEMMAFFEKVDE